MGARYPPERREPVSPPEMQSRSPPPTFGGATVHNPSPAVQVQQPSHARIAKLLSSLSNGLSKKTLGYEKITSLHLGQNELGKQTGAMLKEVLVCG